mgnify:CR=1 FL=1
MRKLIYLEEQSLDLGDDEEDHETHPISEASSDPGLVTSYHSPKGLCPLYRLMRHRIHP